MKELILLRGLPGSGKTTLARILAGVGSNAVFSVDDYFTGPEGDYRFEFDKNHLAYKRCEQQTEAAMMLGEKQIFLHNTFVYDWEMEPYFRLAEKHHYRLHVLTVENYHGGKNVHEVGDEQLEKMSEKYRIRLNTSPDILR